MKRNIVSLVVCICVLSVAQSAMAANAKHQGTISTIYAGTGAVHIELEVNDFDGCANVKGNHYYTLAETHPRFDELYALSLAAAYSNSGIIIRIDESTCNGTLLENSPIIRITQEF